MLGCVLFRAVAAQDHTQHSPSLTRKPFTCVLFKLDFDEDVLEDFRDVFRCIESRPCNSMSRKSGNSESLRNGDGDGLDLGLGRVT